MPRIDVPVTNITRSGVADASETNGNATDNHSIANDGRVWFEARNADASNPHTVTVLFTRTIDGQAVTSRAYALAATTKRRIGPWPPAEYGDTLQVNVDSSELKLAAYHLGT